MLNRLKRYRLYKESGVQWLGEVPEHWAVTPSRAIFREIIIRGHPNEPLLSVTISKGVVLQSELIAHTSKKDSSNEDRSNYKLVEPGDLVYNKMRAWQGAVGVSTYRGLVSPAYIVQRLRDPKDLPRYFHYLLRTPHFAKEAERWSYGITSDQWSLRSEDFKRILFPHPPTNEQRAIVKFLDWADRRIRGIIAARKKRIQLLEEYRQTLINDAVTGKFDVRTGKPYPAYKDSGVEWLGKVPEGWAVRRLKNIVRNINEQTSAVEATTQNLLLSLEHVEGWSGKIRPSAQKEGKPFEGQGKRFLANDILFGKLRPYLAKVARPQRPGICVTEFLVLRPINGIEPAYLEKLLRSHGVIDLINSSTYGAKMPRAEWDFIGSIFLPLPPLPEQRAIAEYLDRETKKIDAAIEKTKKSIELWEELRTKLIADVVTGKYDVREVAEKLPEEEPELESKIEALEASLQKSNKATETVEPEAELEEEPA